MELIVWCIVHLFHC